MMSNVRSSETSNRILPEQFYGLERFAAVWSLQTERERNRKRLSSTMAEIQELYDALLPRMDEIMEYLNQYPLDALPAEAKRLFYLTLSLAEVTPAVEQYGSPAVIDGFPPDRLVPVDVPNMTPSES
jgi:hypothetical protein